MSEELQQKLRDQLWEVANKLRGNMSASDFMYFTLGFIFYKYLSEKIELYMNNALIDDDVTFKELWNLKDADAAELQEEAKKQCFEVIEPEFLFSSVIEAIKRKENILFIDASKEFEKVKTQNKLRPQHIKKIVETYRDRKEIEKYSQLVTMQEIADNDYNLNIPRYVDTFEEEEPIDIKAVMAEIKELEAKRAELDKEIEVYLKELGIWNKIIIGLWNIWTSKN